MKIPVIENADAVWKSWQEGEDLVPKTGWFGEGEQLGLDQVEKVLDELKEIGTKLNDDRIKFDKEAAVVLRQGLPLTAVAAAQPRFWTYLAMQVPELVAWRWKKSDAKNVSKLRFWGGWKNTFRRLWLRADLTKEENKKDPFRLARRGGRGLLGQRHRAQDRRLPSTRACHRRRALPDRRGGSQDGGPPYDHEVVTRSEALPLIRGNERGRAHERCQGSARVREACCMTPPVRP